MGHTPATGYSIAGWCTLGDTVETVVRAQRNRRRGTFWLGFVVLAIAGFLWASAGSQPLVPFEDDFFEEDIFVVDRVGQAIPVPAPDIVFEPAELVAVPPPPLPLPTATPAPVPPAD